jgi:hypothetical protein
MPRARSVLLALPVALAGIGVAVHATVRMAEEQRHLAELAVTGRAAGESFVETLRGENAERQWIAYDQRRVLALAMAASRRDRLLGILAVAAASMFAGGSWVLSRISEEVEEDRRHVAQMGGEGRPPDH